MAARSPSGFFGAALLQVEIKKIGWVGACLQALEKM
jgi:hypothetical protein